MIGRLTLIRVLSHYLKHHFLKTFFNVTTPPHLPIPVAERSKARVYGRSLAGIAGSNPARGMDVSLFWV